MAESNLCELRGKNRTPECEGAISRVSLAEVNAVRGAFARHIVALVHAMNPSYGRDRSPR
jgi:hypothetical protein